MRKFWKICGILVAVLILASIYFYFRGPNPKNFEWGLTFSYKEAEGLGFDWKTMYLDILADLKPKNLRLMTYWDDLEPQKGKFDFTIVDQQLIEADKENLNVVLVVGRKQPRWPECSEPAWFDSLSADQQNQAVLNMLTTSVEHFKQFISVKYWQVENEPFFGFGPNCPTISANLYKQEVDLVKSLDRRPILVTDSGERGSWFQAASSGADILGATVYRVSYDTKYGGYYKYPIPPAFYRIKAGILRSFSQVNDVWDVELQAEPWFTNGALNTPLDLQKTLMNAKVFDENVQYAKSSGFEKNYLWGVEWWYYMAKKNNDWGMWSVAKQLFSTSS
jgi:hypothetical protein